MRQIAVIVFLLACQKQEDPSAATTATASATTSAAATATATASASATPLATVEPLATATEAAKTPAPRPITSAQAAELTRQVDEVRKAIVDGAGTRDGGRVADLKMGSGRLVTITPGTGGGLAGIGVRDH
jgi:hypothetical protein